MVLPSLSSGDVTATAKSFHEMSHQGLGTLEDYQWSVLEDNLTACHSGAIGILDAYDSQKLYRICTKVVFALPCAVRAALHDYGCDNPGASRICIASVFDSLKVGSAQIEPNPI